MTNYSKNGDVHQQYEDFPYPPRDLKIELKELKQTWLEDLPKINHYCFQGKNTFQDDFRALVAGGGTGDATIFLAWQLRNTDAEVVHLDISAASIAIAKARATTRGLTNIVWLQGSLLDLPNMGLKPFDYINCSGVLHHLADPNSGLLALLSVLKPEGALGIMIYAAAGRTAIYQMQELLRRINSGQDSRTDKIETAKEVIYNLPATNWFERSKERFSDYESDAGLYDLLLHSRDRAYTVTEVFEWIEDTHGLHLEFTDVYAGRSTYVPKMVMGLKGRRVLTKIEKLPIREQYAIAELLTSRIKTHSFYATRSPACTAPYGDLEYIPMYFHDPVTGPLMEKIFNTNKNKGKVFILEHALAQVAFPVNPGKYGPRILREIDGEKTFGKIFDIIRNDIEYKFNYPTDENLFKDFTESYIALNSLDRLLLRHQDAPFYPNVNSG